MKLYEKAGLEASPPLARLNWLLHSGWARLVALACSLALAVVLLLCRCELPAAGSQQLRGSAAAAAAAAARTVGSAAAQPLNRTSSLLVVLARHEEDVRWLDQLPQAVVTAPELRIMIYQTPGAEVEWPPDNATLAAARAAAAAPAEPRIDAEWYSKYWPVRYTPMNRGHEAMAYISAILDHWGTAGEGLPDHMAFMHAHQWSEHTHLSHDWVIRALAAHRPQRVPLGYVDAQCSEQNVTWNLLDLSSRDTYTDWLSRKGIDASVDFRQAWRESPLQHWLGPLPRRLHGPSSAEFVVSRAALARHPRRFWEEMRDWLMTTPQLSYRAGLVLEWLWHLILTGQAIVNTPQADCMCSLYGLCLPS